MSKNWDKGDEITAEGLNDTGFGLKVVAQETPGMTLRVNKGVAIVSGQTIKYAGGNTGTITAPSSNPRIDLITIDSSGVIGTTAGAEDPSPTAPAYPTDKTVLAEIYLRPSCTSIKNNDDSSQGYIYRDSRALGAPVATVSTPSGSADAGKIPVLGADGKLPIGFLTQEFGGDGSDGALTITSGTTTLSAGNAKVFTKNYTSISITGTGALAFSNPHSGGTLVVLKSQGDVVLTSSATPMIDLRGMGSAGGAGSTTSTPNPGTSAVLNDITITGGGDTTTSVGTYSRGRPNPEYRIALKYGGLSIGSGGGGGGGQSGGTGGSGGRGGGSLIIECAGSLNFTTASGINASGADGTGRSGAGGGGGGGGGGHVLIVAAAITANTGTIIVNGGTGSLDGNAQAGGPGGGGASANGSTGAVNKGGNGGAGKSNVMLLSS